MAQSSGSSLCPPYAVGMSCQEVSTRKPRSVEFYVKTVPLLVSGET